ncbi:hypothetical protein CHS0354_002183 [Potamilus streckersoni]|uniref:Uncharacterized protein n=1 Tax=Potamilus streckersoni TaxID=2493646 RepID=A0AAE0VI90_9BIVA|nr:hypothetical protein CHS0354_002183 [Potamilus streckersoni]
MSSYDTYPDMYEGWGGGRRTIGVKQMRPSQLRFTHDSISSRFKDGHTMEETFMQLLNGEISLKEVRSLVAMEYQGYWFVVRGNRRLYIMKKLEDIGNISTISVLLQTFDQQVFVKQFSTKNMGLSLKVRGDPFLEQKLNRIVSEWRNNRSGGNSGWYNYSGSGRLRGESNIIISDSTGYNYLGRQSYIPNQQVQSTTNSPSRTVSQPRVISPEPTKDTSSSKEDGSWCVIL